MEDLDLRQALLAAVDQDSTLEIIPYCNTPEFFRMVAYYQAQSSLTITLPESPSASLSWFRDSLDGKSVFAMLAPALLEGTACRFAPRVVADSIPQAAAAVQAFLAQSQACVVKPEVGYLGLGLMPFDPSDPWTMASLEAHLRTNATFGHRKISVEAWIRSGTESQSPSVEVFVPRQEKPYVTYLCDQVFSANNLFAGIALRPEFYATAWAKTLCEGALAVAERLQSLGYGGYFDLDAVVDPDGQVYVIEMNPRRTGGTHVHDLAEFLVGQDYRDRVALLSGSLTLKQPCTWPELEAVLREVGWLYPQGAVIPVQTSSLPWGVFGYVILAAEWEAIQIWQRRLLALLA